MATKERMSRVLSSEGGREGELFFIHARESLWFLRVLLCVFYLFCGVGIASGEEDSVKEEDPSEGAASWHFSAGTASTALEVSQAMWRDGLLKWFA